MGEKYKIASSDIFLANCLPQEPSLIYIKTLIEQILKRGRIMVASPFIAQ